MLLLRAQWVRCPDQIAAALAAASADCVVTDVGSIKAAIVASARDERFVGGHPIAGAETAGVEHARADLFEGAVWYLTPTESSEGILYERLHRLIASFGAPPDRGRRRRRTTACSPPSAICRTCWRTRSSPRPPVAPTARAAFPRIGPSFRDATRVAGANSAIWTDIYTANAAAIAAEIDATVVRLQAAADLLRAGDADAITAWNEAAAADRRRLLEADLADGAVHELRLTVPNRPGIVAQVALALGKAGVNIVDLSLAPAPDHRTGAMTLWVAGDDQAARASALIAELGFPVAAA